MFKFLFHKNKIKVNGITHGSHGDHWGAFFGFEKISTNPQLLLNELVKVVGENKGIKIDNKYSQTIKNMGVVDIIVISDAQKISSSFPNLKSKYTLPFVTKEINEWNHADNIEAQIIGGGRKTFALNFFATDYLKNKKIYKTNKELNINVSAFAYVIKQSSNLPDNFSDNFVAYFPNMQVSDGSVYDFIGKIVSFEEYKQNGINGFVIKTKLINHEKMEDFFVLDIFINQDNMRIEKPKKGMRIFGCFWLQGNIAENCI